MNPKEQYAEKLKDPRWQKKRLLVLERAGWRCAACDCEDRTLHVHHLKYVGANPWDTPDDFLECLCESCHERREEMNRMFAEMMRESRTKHLDAWGRQVRTILATYDTAPAEVQAGGAASFVFVMMNLAMEQFWVTCRGKKAEEPPAPSL